MFALGRTCLAAPELAKKKMMGEIAGLDFTIRKYYNSKLSGIYTGCGCGGAV